MNGALVVVIGLDGEPTASLLADLRRLGHRTQLIAWPVPDCHPERSEGPRRSSLTSPTSGAGSPQPAAVLVDLRVLGVDAAAACRAARRDRRLRLAPLVAVVPEQEAARLDLSLGFDDLALAPYRISDLAARLRLLRWRQQQNAAAPGQVIRAGRLALNPATYQVTIAGGAGLQPATVDLTLKEHQLLLFLLRNPNRVFERSELLDRVWGADYYGGTRTVDVHVRRLREKTSAAGDLIETVRGVGYRLALPT